MARLHHRMPVVVERDLEDDWLDPEITSTSDVLGMLERSAGANMAMTPWLIVIFGDDEKTAISSVNRLE
jgi:putative SOS response-associated peptidase YedK